MAEPKKVRVYWKLNNHTTRASRTADKPREAHSAPAWYCFTIPFSLQLKRKQKVAYSILAGQVERKSCQRYLFAQEADPRKGVREKAGGLGDRGWGVGGGVCSSQLRQGAEGNGGSRSCLPLSIYNCRFLPEAQSAFHLSPPQLSAFPFRPPRPFPSIATIYGCMLASILVLWVCEWKDCQRTSHSVKDWAALIGEVGWK